MATFLLLAQLLFLGTAAVSAQTEPAACPHLGNATEGNFSIQVTPKDYQANTTYQVTILKGNSTDKPTVKFVLQALSPWNESLGEWMGVSTANCSSVDSAILNPPQNAANWTSPGTNVSSVQIRAFITFSDTPAEFRTETLNRALKPTTMPPPTSPNSVSTVQSCSFFMAVLQLPLVLATSTLLS